MPRRSTWQRHPMTCHSGLRQVEDAIQSGDGEHLDAGWAGSQQLQVIALAFGPLMGTDEHAQRGGVDERDSGEIYTDVPEIEVEEVMELAAEETRGRDVEV